MKKLLIIIFSLILIIPVFSAEKKNSKIKIGISKIVSHPALDSVEKGIKDELKEMGYNNIKYDLQNANGDINAAKMIAEKFKQDKVNVAVGIATPTAQALVGTITDIPIVFSAVTDPEGAGLVRNTQKGDANVTGVSDLTPVEQQIHMLKKIIDIKKLGIIYSSNEVNSITIAKLTKKACKMLKIKYIEATVVNSAEVKMAAESIIDRVDAIYISTDNTVVSAFSSVVDVATRRKIPIMSADPSSAAKIDVLAAYGFNYYKMGRVTGKVIAEILEGKKTIDMPTRYMTDQDSLDLLINLDVAKNLNIDIPKYIKDAATIIIENGKIINK